MHDTSASSLSPPGFGAWQQGRCAHTCHECVWPQPTQIWGLAGRKVVLMHDTSASGLSPPGVGVWGGGGKDALMRGTSVFGLSPLGFGVQRGTSGGLKMCSHVARVRPASARPGLGPGAGEDGLMHEVSASGLSPAGFGVWGGGGKDVLMRGTSASGLSPPRFGAQGGGGGGKGALMRGTSVFGLG